ncbi:MAG TPA: DNA polymerase III subunit alpha [Lentisphaeria bacterium]|nr:MAG: DNA polymerase III subunit alpha [Lentisphaerae bacterium GWF2_38_69]HBM16262.1 DNA polymerase III subunit alpha [Lentisphaeria bacterium]
MSSTPFVHLHVHTDYSLLDGACHIYHKEKGKTDIVKLAKEYNMPAVAITDHGVMGGALDFYKQMDSNGIKPIIGCEMYVSPTHYKDRDQNVPNIKGYHLVLLAKDIDGYRNLCKLDSLANLEGIYYKPRVDKELLRKYSKGLIALSACLQGELAVNILAGKTKEAKNALSDYLEMYGKDNFYLELMDHGMEEQKIVNKALISMAKEFGVGLVATNDAHYLKKEHHKSHELLLCIQTNNVITDEKRFKFHNDQFYFKNGDEMLEIFKEVPEAITNTLAVADKCNLVLDFKANHYPVYKIGEGQSHKEYLKAICLEELPERYGFKYESDDKLTKEQQRVINRLDHELTVIDKSRYCSYFLVVWDFLKYARETGVPVGPGRGSGAGSIVAYLTNITNVDPLRYNLLFERFLNPDRVSPPDFDIDFCERRRGEVIEYVRAKYGQDSVAQIGTYGTLKAKAVIKDIGRALGHSFDQRNMITKLMPADPNLTLEGTRENNSDLIKFMDENEWVKEIFMYAEPLENLNRNMSTHAAGVIIGDQPLDNLVPLTKDSEGGIITQYPAGPCESLGLLKMDFLGLKTLTIIQDTIDAIKKTRDIDLDINRISLEDKNAYSLLNRGDTIAVFQLESGGMRDLCKRFGVNRIEDISALLALYRPGPMQFIGDFINRKFGKEMIDYDHSSMEQVLKETYGIMLYQEQIMQVVQVVAGFTLGQADILRRAIGKKKIDEMAKQKEKFVKGCYEFNQISEEKASAIWEKISKFAEYGFNKSHSVAYAFVAYQTAFLKANYPVEFMCSVLTSEVSNPEKIVFFIKECKEMGIKVLAPDVNVSNMNFTVDGASIRFGISAIKGVGGSASDEIIKARSNDKFKDLTDFAERAGTKLNTRVMESLIRAGALDCFGYKRSQLLHVMADVVRKANQTLQDKINGQGNLFDFMGDSKEESNDNPNNVIMPDIPEVDEKKMLEDEKELLGFYVSGHPLGEYAGIIELYSTTSIMELKSNGDEDFNLHEHEVSLRIGGIIASLDIKSSKKDGSKFAVINFEDLGGTIECVVFGRTYKEYTPLIELNKPVFIEGIASSKDEGGNKKITVNKIMTMEDVQKDFTEELHIHINEGTTKTETLHEIRNSLTSELFKGKTDIILCSTLSSGEKAFIEAGKNFMVRVNNDLINQLKCIVGEESVKIRANKKPPEYKKPAWQKNGNGHSKGKNDYHSEKKS